MALPILLFASRAFPAAIFSCFLSSFCNVLRLALAAFLSLGSIKASISASLISVDFVAAAILALASRAFLIERFSFPLWMLETFVDPQRFQGTLYKASNWMLVGQTSGFGKQGAGYIHHGCKKEVFVYVLDTDFRKYIGCEPKPSRFYSRPPLNQEKLEALKMILRDIDWHPEIEASLDLNTDEILSIAEELVSFHEQFHDSFKRIEQRRLGLGYLQGLLSNCERKSAEPIALNLFGKKEVRALQRFMQNYR